MTLDSPRDLQQRTVLVTGGARRVGEAISRHLAERGARVLVHYHASGHRARSLVEELPHGGQAFGADLRSASGPQELLEACRAAGEFPDSLVHSAASFLRRPLLETTVEEWDAVLDLNLRSLFLLAQEFVHLRTRYAAGADPAAEDGQARGHMVAISDAAALDIWPNYLAHSVAKAGVLALVRGLAKSLAPRFQVNAVVPGPVLPPEDLAPERVELIRQRTLLERIGDPLDVAKAVAFLLTSSYTTGAAIEVTGGSQLWREPLR